MSRSARALAALCFLACASCSSSQLSRLPTYDDCMNMPPGKARFVRASEVSSEDIPTMIPFASLRVAASTRRDCEVAAVEAGKRLNADLVCLGDIGSVYAGSVATAVVANGVATGISTPSTIEVVDVWCFRLSPVSLGLKWDSAGVVSLVAESARNCGIQEGDQVMSVGGSVVSKGADGFRSPHLRKMLKLQPGEEVPVVWVRPGSGRMDGKVTCVANPPKHLDLPDVSIEIMRVHRSAEQD